MLERWDPRRELWLPAFIFTAAAAASVLLSARAAPARPLVQGVAAGDHPATAASIRSANAAAPGQSVVHAVAKGDIPVHVIALGSYWKTRQGRSILSVQRRLLASLANSDYTRVLHERYHVKGQIRLGAVTFDPRRALRVYNMVELEAIVLAAARKLPQAEARHLRAKWLVLLPPGSRLFTTGLVGAESCGFEFLWSAPWPFRDPRELERRVLSVYSMTESCAPWGLDRRGPGGITGRVAATSRTTTHELLGATLAEAVHDGHSRLVHRCEGHEYLWRGRGGVFVVTGYWNGKRCAAGSATAIRRERYRR